MEHIFRFNNRLPFITIVILFIVTLTAYLSAFVSPEKIWLGGLISYSIFPLLIVNLALFIFLLILKKKTILFPMIALVLGFYFIKLTIKIPGFTKIVSKKEQINILSFNSDFFQTVVKHSGSADNLTSWMINDSAHVKCIQEYRTIQGDSNINLYENLLSEGYNAYEYIYDISNGNKYGMAIFSRYPIVRKGNLNLNKQSKNNCIFIDVLVNKDTLRIYNIHLSSMNIPKLNRKRMLSYGAYLKTVYLKLKEGMLKHSKEINYLIEHTELCHYPFVICGDFNEIPYSYNYLLLRKHFYNSFEKAGKGFGFSFNSQRLFFLRIDHHFYGKGITPVKYRVDYSVLRSGHYPTRGIYLIQ